MVDILGRFVDGIHSADAVGVLMEAVVAELFIHPQKDQNAAGDPYGKTGDIDNGIRFLILHGP
jgi:hypothetical protein